MAADQQEAIEEAQRADATLENATPQDVLTWAAGRFSPELTMACSFGGPTGMVLLDMVTELGLAIPVFYLDTDFLFPETHQLIAVAIERYGIEPKAYRPRWSVAGQASEFGAELWKRDPDLCCAIRKVEPNGRALEGKRAWITGLRRDQAPSRKQVAAVEWDAKFELFKVNPLVRWSEEQVWDYIREHDVPYNVLHDRGYPSIGCTNCTRPVTAGENSRAGRWSGSDKVECGLHVDGGTPAFATGVHAS